VKLFNFRKKVNVLEVLLAAHLASVFWQREWKPLNFETERYEITAKVTGNSFM